MNEKNRRTCVLCGNDTSINKTIVASIGGNEYVFDREECVLLLRKFLKVYGKNFELILNPARTTF